MGISVTGDAALMGLVIIPISSFASAAVVCMLWHWSKVYRVKGVQHWQGEALHSSAGVDVASNVASTVGGVAKHIHVGSGVQWG